MKNTMILCRRFGEVSYTSLSPVREWQGEADKANLQDTKQCIWSNDDYRPVTMNLWEVRAMQLPDWLSGDDYAHDFIKWDSLWTTPEANTMPQDWQMYLALGLDDPKERHALAKLLTANTKSKFRQSLRAQVVDWLATEPDQRKYSRPLSWKQLSALLKWER